MARTRTNIEIENDYVDAIIERFGLRTKTEAVDLAPVSYPHLAVYKRQGHAATTETI